MQDVRHVENRRPALRTGVEHFEERLEVSVQINRRRGNASKYQFLVAVIPPPMRAADGKARPPTGLDLKMLAIQRGGKDAGNNLAMFGFSKVNVEWRALPVGR